MFSFGHLCEIWTRLKFEEEAGYKVSTLSKFRRKTRVSVSSDTNVLRTFLVYCYGNYTPLL
jgi:hypothetical protein